MLEDVFLCGEEYRWGPAGKIPDLQAALSSRDKLKTEGTENSVYITLLIPWFARFGI